MSGYRDVEPVPGRAKTKLVLPGAAAPPWAFQVGLVVTALGGVGAIMHPSTSVPWLLITVGLATLAMSVRGGRAPSMVLDRTGDALEIHHRNTVRRLRISSIDEVVTERTHSRVTILLRTRLGEEIPVWSGSVGAEDDVVAEVQSAIIEPLTEAKYSD